VGESNSFYEKEKIFLAFVYAEAMALRKAPWNLFHPGRIFLLPCTAVK